MIVSDGPGREAGTRLYPVGDAARLADYLREYIDRGIKRGKIPATRVNGVRMVALDDVIADKARRAPR
jgi:hypothetical protein